MHARYTYTFKNDNARKSIQQLYFRYSLPLFLPLIYAFPRNSDRKPFDF